MRLRELLQALMIDASNGLTLLAGTLTPTIRVEPALARSWLIDQEHRSLR